MKPIQIITKKKITELETRIRILEERLDKHCCNPIPFFQTSIPLLCSLCGKTKGCPGHVIC